MTRICRNKSDLALAFAEGTALLAAGKPVAVTVRLHDRRSLDQNALFHEWMGVAAMVDPQHDAAGWKAIAKLHHGVPILRAESADFRAFYDAALKSRSYEEKIAAMAFVPVTSIMTTAQMSRFMDEVRAGFAAQGIHLEGA